MTGERPEPGRDLLADLDAGVLDDDPGRAAQVRAAAAADPGATAVLAALAATRADLADLADPPVPAHVAARWDAALEAEARAAGPARPHPRHRVAAVLVAAAAVTGLLWTQAAGPPAGRSPSLDRVDLVAAARTAFGATDAGALADPARRVGCLRAVAPPGVPADAPLLGGRRVRTGGTDAVLLLLGTGELGRFHVVVVDPGCGPGGGRLLHAQVIGR